MKKYNPITPSRRHMSTISYRSVLTASEPHKALTKGGTKRAGRNSDGRITVRHKGGGHKRLHRLIDFTYDKKNIPAKIETIEYDPYRSGFIALVCYADGERRYVLAPKSLKVGDTFLISENAELKAGNRLPLKLIPVGTFIFNIELQPNNGAKLVRGAGNYAELVANDSGYAHIKMPSGEVRKIIDSAWASIGEVSNAEHKLVNFGKAGRTRWKGVRPTVRGSAMNPVDHPFGGGEGRQGAGMRRPKNLWGRGIRGVKTRRPKKYSNIFIVSRRTKKKRT
ncbi:MAG: 50S ribosomal protein L2 [Candidatus Lloydbacteria bacterium]|nr:50S ribosomal protein L2 [Candidatus Lloydbacteria bacterium]